MDAGQISRRQTTSKWTNEAHIRTYIIKHILSRSDGNGVYEQTGRQETKPMDRHGTKPNSSGKTKQPLEISRERNGRADRSQKANEHRIRVFILENGDNDSRSRGREGWQKQIGLRRQSRRGVCFFAVPPWSVLAALIRYVWICGCRV